MRLTPKHHRHHLGATMPFLNPVTIGAVVLVLLLVAYMKSKARPAEPALSQEYKKFRVEKIEDITHNVVLFRIFFPNPNQVLGLPPGQHVYLRFHEGERPISRAYTPVSSADQKGHLDLVIKIYDDGKMGQHLITMPGGKGTIEMRGPSGRLKYLGEGRFDIRGRSQKAYKNIGMIAGGSGLTPMLQILRAIAHSPKDRTQVTFIFANQEERDIVQREELEALAEKFPNIKVYFNLDRPTAGWTGGKGYVTEETLEASEFPKMGDDTIVLVCGPPPMCQAMERLLDKVNCDPENRFIF